MDSFVLTEQKPYFKISNILIRTVSNLTGGFSL